MPESDAAITHIKSPQQSSPLITFCGNALASFTTVGLYQSADTALYRLMSSKMRYFDFNPIVMARNMNQIVFAEDASAHAWKKFHSLNRGIWPALQTKFLQRVSRVNGQSLTQDFMESHGVPKVPAAGVAGVAMALKEVAFVLPFEMLKMRQQLNPQEAKLTVFEIFKRHPLAECYYGGVLTGVYKSALYGTLFSSREWLCSKGRQQGISEDKSEMIGAFGGAAFASGTTHAIDVVRSRMYADYPIDYGIKGRQLAYRMFQTEGLTCFTRGIFTKLFFQTGRIGTQLYLMTWFVNKLASVFKNSDSEQLRP